MLATAQTFTLDAISARPVRVEVDVRRGLPAFSVVGLPDAAVREARERVRAALTNCGFEFPLRRIVANRAGERPQGRARARPADGGGAADGVRPARLGGGAADRDGRRARARWLG